MGWETTVAFCSWVSQPFAPAWHTKSGSSWSSVSFQPLHDLNLLSRCWRSFLGKDISLCLMERSWNHVSSYTALQSWLFDLCLGELPLFSQGLLNISRDVHHPGASRKVLITSDESAHVSCRRND